MGHTLQVALYGQETGHIIRCSLLDPSEAKLDLIAHKQYLFLTTSLRQSHSHNSKGIPLYLSHDINRETGVCDCCYYLKRIWASIFWEHNMQPFPESLISSLYLQQPFTFCLAFLSVVSDLDYSPPLLICTRS